MDKMSPSYQMKLVQSISEKLFECYHSYDKVKQYLSLWYECDYLNDNCENFHFVTKTTNDNKTIIDTGSTLHLMSGELLLKIAIDLGIETPNFIPSIPIFKNELKSDYETAYQIFEKAYQNIEKDPSLSIGLANSAFESVVKEILNDKRVTINDNEKKTLKKLTETICKAFKEVDNECTSEITRVTSSLITLSQAIEDLRSTKTILHGKTDSSPIVTDSIYAKLIVNAVTTVGLFFLDFYKSKYPKNKTNSSDEDDLPF